MAIKRCRYTNADERALWEQYEVVLKKGSIKDKSDSLGILADYYADMCNPRLHLVLIEAIACRRHPQAVCGYVCTAARHKRCGTLTKVLALDDSAPRSDYLCLYRWRSTWYYASRRRLPLTSVSLSTQRFCSIIQHDVLVHVSKRKIGLIGHCFDACDHITYTRCPPGYHYKGGAPSSHTYFGHSNSIFSMSFYNAFDAFRGIANTLPKNNSITTLKL